MNTEKAKTIRIELTHEQAQLILKGLRAVKSKAKKKYDPAYVPEDGKYDANLSLMQRSDEVMDLIKYELNYDPERTAAMLKEIGFPELTTG